MTGGVGEVGRGFQNKPWKNKVMKEESSKKQRKAAGREGQRLRDRQIERQLVLPA